jgi:hypothetical protein
MRKKHRVYKLSRVGRGVVGSDKVRLAAAGFSATADLSRKFGRVM